MSSPSDTFAPVGAAAIESYFRERGVEPKAGGEGRFTVYLPLSEGSDERLQTSFASTPATGGILVRVQARRLTPKHAWPALVWACNEWNRRNPAPRAVLAPRKQGEALVAACLLEDWLPASAEPDGEQIQRFIETVVGGARRFWQSEKMRQLAPRV